ncbi:MAG TPA: 4-alpha-glucanotransferase [Geobacteraceae bacterium]
MLHRRQSGILLHPTSLPGPGGIGAMGSEARRFVDFLASAGQSLWQVLPLGPTGLGNSPYSCLSAFAGNPLLIDLEQIALEGDLAAEELRENLPPERVDFPAVEEYKETLLKRAATNFLTKGDPGRREEFRSFCETTPWLDDFALFMALKEAHGGKGWLHWPRDMACRDAAALADCRERLKAEAELHKYAQWQFFRQWRELREYANEKGIGIVGDLPIFVAFDSADVWANPHLFHLDERGRSTVVAGVPPDYFSETGQRWGNPLYNWETIAFHGYGFWIERMKCAMELCDMVRIDHFRGFEAYWEIPATEKTAQKGRWVKGPGAELFSALLDSLGQLPIIAEDLGVITPDVEALRDRFGFPGMKVLQFAFGSGPDNPYLPHNHVRGAVVYTGTHDNDTTIGWFSGLGAKERGHVLRYLASHGKDIAGTLSRAALASVANTAIIPLQDVLGLDSRARMNVPGKSAGNWAWRFAGDMLTEEVGEKLLEMTEMYGRVQRKRS